MAPIKRIARQANQPNMQQPANPAVLQELLAIRNSLQLSQQSLTRLENRFKISAPPSPTPTVPPMRRLLNEIADRPITSEICWYHSMKMFMKAYGLRNKFALECQNRFCLSQ